MNVVQVVALCLAAVAGVIDIRSHRIPNWLTVGSAAAALIYHAARFGDEGVAVAGLGWLLGAAAFFAPFALGGLGAGDVKLVAALGAWLGPGDVLWLALVTGVAGGLLALGFSLAHGYGRQAFDNVRLLVTHWRRTGVHPLPALTLAHGRGPRLPYGVAVFAGTVVTVLMRAG